MAGRLRVFCRAPRPSGPLDAHDEVVDLEPTPPGWGRASRWPASCVPPAAIRRSVATTPRARARGHRRSPPAPSACWGSRTVQVTSPVPSRAMMPGSSRSHADDIGTGSGEGVDDGDEEQEPVDQQELRQAVGQHQHRRRRDGGHDGQSTGRERDQRGCDSDQRGAGTDGQDAVEDAVDRGALELELGPQLHAVPERRLDDGLHLVGGHVRPTREPGPRLRRVEQHGRAARRDTEADRRRVTGRPGDGHE